MHSLCPLCGSARTRPLPSIAERHNIFDGDYRLYSCADCEMIYTSPAPHDFDNSRLYAEDYYSFQSTSLESLPVWRSVARVIAAIIGYIRRTKLKHVVLLERALFFLMRNVPQITPLFFPGDRILDVGCGSGDQVALWLNCGRHAMGVDKSPLAAAKGEERGLQISAGELQEAGFSEDYVDIVYANHVLEHTVDPHVMINEIVRVLKPGGILIVGVPNISSLSFQLFKSKWYHLDVPRHIVHFSPRTLTALLAAHGLRAIKTYTITPAGGLLGSLGNMVPSIGDFYRSGRPRTLFLTAYIMLTLLQLPMNLFLSGDWLYIIAVKE